MKLIENPSLSLWGQVISQSEYGTFFHTPTWAHIVSETYPNYSIQTKGFVLDDGAVAIIPVLCTVERNRYFKWFESMYLGGYGGFVAQRDLTQPELEEMYRRLIKNHIAHLHVIGNPFTYQILPDIFIPSPLYTHTINLKKGEQEVIENFSKSRKRDIDIAKKMGVEIGIAETEDEFSEYFQIYQDTIRRWGEATLVHYPYELFRNIQKHLSDKIKLWVARINGQIISGALFLYSTYQANYWHGATLEKYFNYKPSAFLMSEVIRDACQKGYKIFDMGPSGGLQGVEDFKERFGAQKLGFCSYEWNGNQVYQAYQNIYRNLGKKLINQRF